MEDLPREIETIDLTEKENVKPVTTEKEIKAEQNVSKYEPDVKEIKKKEIKKFNENPKTKEFGVKLITKTTIYSFYLIIFLLLVLLTLNIFWHNTIFNKLAERDFSTIINNEPNITSNLTANVNASVNIPTTNEFYNNFTINLTVVLPDNLNLNITNSS